MTQKISKIKMMSGGEYVEVIPEAAQSAVNDGSGNNICDTYATKSNLSDGSVTKVGTATVGSNSKPIFISKGVPTVCTGVAIKDDLTNGSVTKIGTSTIGSTSKPIYLKFGVPATCSEFATKSDITSGAVTKVGTATVGGVLRPMYLNSGAPAAGTQLYARSMTVNGSTHSGVIRSVNTDLPSFYAPVAVGSSGQVLRSNGSGEPTWLSDTVGSASKPVYMNAGVPTPISATVGGTTRPIYLNAGVPMACDATVGGPHNPVYLNAGTLTAVESIGQTVDSITLYNDNSGYAIEKDTWAQVKLTNCGHARKDSALDFSLPQTGLGYISVKKSGLYYVSYNVRGGVWGEGCLLAEVYFSGGDVQGNVSMGEAYANNNNQATVVGSYVVYVSAGTTIYLRANCWTNKFTIYHSDLCVTSLTVD